MLNKFHTGFAPASLCYDSVTSTVLGIFTGGALGGITAYGAAKNAADKKKAGSEVDKAKTDAEQKALMDVQEQEKNRAARRSLLDQPTSGFGPNTNLARSFLTSL